MNNPSGSTILAAVIRLCSFGVALWLAGCDLAFQLDPPDPFEGDKTLYAATEVALEGDFQTDLVILDRTPNATAVHVVYGDPEPQFGERMVTKPLAFRPLAFTLVRLAMDARDSLFVVGVAEGRGRFGRARARMETEIDDVVEYALAGDLPAITGVARISVVNGFIRLAMLTDGRAVVTKPFVLDEPTIEVVTLESELSQSAILFVSTSDLWVIDDDHATRYPIESDGALGEPARQDWPNAPSDLRVASNTGAFGVGARVQAFSTNCATAPCVLTWHAISTFEPLGVHERLLDTITISHLLFTEVGGGNNYTDLATFGRQADGDVVATLLIDNYYDGTTFSTQPPTQRFPRTACPEAKEALVVTSALMTQSPYRSLILIDANKRGYTIGPASTCTALPLELP